MNLLGLSYLFFYGDDHNVAAIQRAWEEGRAVDWSAEATKALAANRGACLGVLVLLGAALLALLHRGRPPDGLFAGLVLVYACLHLAHYDYVVLSLVPFMFPGRRDALVTVAVFWIAVAAVRLVPQAAAVPDLRFFVLSWLTALYVAAMLVRCFRAQGEAGGGPGGAAEPVGSGAASRRGPAGTGRRAG